MGVGTASAPYTVSLGTVGSGVPQAANLAQNGGLVTAALLKATRGIPQSGTTPAITATPTACIGPDVIFNEVSNSGVASGVNAAALNTANQGVALCDPNGCVPGAGGSACAGAPAGGGTANEAVGALAAGQTAAPIPSASQTFTINKQWYQGVAAAAANDRKPGVKLNVQKFWDPITAAQASGGAFCCAALYYSADGVGRGTIDGVTKNSAFTPVTLSGGAMEAATVPGGMCSDGSPSTSVKEGLSEALNVKEKEFLEGQAFYSVLAPSMYVLPKVNSLQATQTANAAKQKTCAQTLTQMLKMNQVTKGTSTSSGVCKADARVAAGTTGTTNAACTGTGHSAVTYPLWPVKIGDGTSPAEYVVPNGYCYANACLEDFAAVGTATAFKGVTKLSTLQSSPDMSSNPFYFDKRLWTRQRGLCSCAFYLERWSGRLQNLLKDHYCTGSCY